MLAKTRPYTWRRSSHRTLHGVSLPSIGLEEAFFETGATFEDPAFRQFFVRVDASEHPAEDVVFLHHMRRERRLRRDVEDFALIDQSLSSSAPALRNKEAPLRDKLMATLRRIELRITRR
jgi:hypothetical protein